MVRQRALQKGKCETCLSVSLPQMGHLYSCFSNKSGFSDNRSYCSTGNHVGATVSADNDSGVGSTLSSLPKRS